ncbi:MAG TPA: ATP-dependent zinc metalloprotease FtsH [Acidimicrobiales bacterium]|nr:ATP-dependent zinc metalloprotease FtsH [Acidimicrobiales bacterium]
MADAPNDPTNPNGLKKFLPGGEKPMAPQVRRRIVTIAIIAFVLGVLVIPNLFSNKQIKTVAYSALIQDAKSHKVLSAVISTSTGVISGQMSNGTNYTSNGPVPALSNEVSTLSGNNVMVTFATPSSLASLLLPYLIWILIFGAFMFYVSRQARGQMNGMMSVGRSKAKQFNEDRPKTTFDDVAGYLGVKQEISEVVEFLKNPLRYQNIGARIPKGILLVGPPGTGKTMLARAVAGEAGVPFFSVSGSDFMEMFVGVGASRVRDLFATARKQSPAIVFVDEIDSIGRKRGAGLGGGHDEREQTLNQMLSEMDGFEPTEGIVVIAATNRPDVLDPALLRPGRFDRQIVVPLPDLEERLPILEVHAKGKPLDPSVDMNIVARGTPGMSGADLANLVNEAALHAVRRNSVTIGMEDFESSRDRVLMGQERDTMVLQDDERERIAFHESGHALLAYVLDKTDPLHKITIIPRGMALGVTMTLPEEDRHIMSRQHLEDSLCMRMGGRVAELLVYGDLSTGAADDLQRNTELARRMVREWGMSKEIGPMAWGSNNQVFLGEDLMHTRDYSDHTSKVIDDEIERILREQESRAIEVLTLHRRGLESLTRALLEHETIDGADAARLIDEANGEPVHPEGTKTVSALSGVGKSAAKKEATPVAPAAATPATPPVPATANWQPPTLPAV